MFFKTNKRGAPFAGSGIKAPKKPQATRQAADQVGVATAVQKSSGPPAATGARSTGRLALPPAPQPPKKR